MTARTVRRGLLVVLVVVGGVTAALIGTRGGSAVGGGFAGISSIPGMTKVVSGSFPACQSRGAPPSYCNLVGSTTGLEETWVSTAAINAFGTLNHGLPLPLPSTFTGQHPGPAQVSVMVVSLATEGDATSLLNNPDYTGSWDPNYIALPSASVNGGVAARLVGPALDGQIELRFIWVSGTSVVQVNVLGAHLTVAQAQAVANLAQPG
jgi:hypothetical protein